MGGHRRVDRRGFLVLGAALAAAAGCSDDQAAVPRRSPHPGPVSPTTVEPTHAASSPTAQEPEARLPVTAAWQPSPGDVDPAVKQTAARLVEALGSWEQPAGGGITAAGRRIAALGHDSALAKQAWPLLGAGTSAAIRVMFAQYGGILSSSASVMVICRQWRIASNGLLVPGGTTVDVRLTADRPHWRVTALHPARPGPPAAPLSASAERVLNDHRIGLPPAAYADVASGRVHDSVLNAMLRLATRYRIDVSVIRSGHPIDVFGTDRESDHPQGRAFDTWGVNGRAIVDPTTPRALVTDYMSACRDAGSYNVGGPYWLPGPGNQFFSNPTHHDHVHAGFLS